MYIVHYVTTFLGWKGKLQINLFILILHPFSSKKTMSSLAHNERKIPIMREKISIRKEKSLSWMKNPYHGKKNSYHERKIPIMKEKSLSWKKNPYQERKIPIMKGFSQFNIYLPRVEIPSHFHRIDLIKFQGYFQFEKHFWKNICILNWFSARANFLLKWFNTGFYQYCIF